MAYSILECFGPMDQERASIDDAPSIPGVQWILGHKITQPVPRPLRIKMDPGLMMPMFYRGILLFSDEMLEGLWASGVDNLDVYDTVLTFASSGETYTNYKAVNIIGKVAAADLANSEYSAPSGTAKIDTDFDSLAIDPFKAQNLLVFRLAECLTAIVVHDRVKHTLIERGIEHLDFVKPENWIG